MHGAAKISPDEQRGAWREELRATLALAWPLILANLTQQADPGDRRAADGPARRDPIGRATLALNLTFTFNLLMLGLVIASSPMMATALGQRFNAVRDVRRTFRAGLWLIAFMLPPYWLLLWHVGDHHARVRTVRTSSRARARLPPRLHVVHRAVAAVPAAAQFRLRARAAEDRPLAQHRRDRPQRAAQLVADLRPFRAAGAWAASAAASAAPSPG